MTKNKVAKHSVKTNFVYNIISTVSGLLFPLLTFPYASRVLMADGIGQVQFFTSIINYVVLLTSLGIPMYAIREIARVRDNQVELSKTTAEIILLSLFLAFLGYIGLAVICFVVDEVQLNIPLFLILSSTLLISTIGCSWFYSGVEDFKFVTLQGLVVKVVCVAFLYIFVKTPEDLLCYGVYTVLGSIGNYIINFFRLHSYVSLSSFAWRDLRPFRHLKPALAIFILNLVTSIYINLDTVMVGFLQDNAAVGYYTAATKISHLVLTLVVALGPVMLPRLSNLVKNENEEEFYRLANKSYKFSLLLSFPMCMGLIVMSPTMIHLFSGDSFEPAVNTLQIISPIIVAIAISNLIGIQVLYPLGKIKTVTISTCIGAIINFSLNLLLIPKYSQNGAAMATVAAEWGVTLTLFILAYKILPFKIINRSFIKYGLSSIVMAILCGLFMSIGWSDAINIIAVPAIGVLIYGGLMLLFRDDVTRETLNIVKNKFTI